MTCSLQGGADFPAPTVQAGAQAGVGGQLPGLRGGQWRQKCQVTWQLRGGLGGSKEQMKRRPLKDIPANWRPGEGNLQKPKWYLLLSLLDLHLPAPLRHTLKQKGLSRWPVSCPQCNAGAHGQQQQGPQPLGSWLLDDRAGGGPRGPHICRTSALC